jgi:ribosomal protein L21
LGLEDGAELNVSEVLACFDEKGHKVALGMPYVAKAHVLFHVVSSQKGEKIRVVKFKRKNRYERTI